MVMMTRPPDPAPPARLTNIDGLRALCALSVLLFHYSFRDNMFGYYPALTLHPAIVSATKYGFLGVDLFFCISGFVIAYSASGRTALTFAISRFSRIYPTFIVCMSLTFVARLLWGGEFLSTSFMQYLSNFTMLPQVFHQQFMGGVYWSIVTEIIFYSWVFALMLAGVMWRYDMAIMCIWLLISVLNEYVFDNGAVRLLFITHFCPFFILGMLLYRMRMATKFNILNGVIFALALAFGIAMLTAETQRTGDGYLEQYSSVVASLYFLFLLSLLIAAIFSKKLFLSEKFLLWCGGISYPLYLLHETTGMVFFINAQGASHPYVTIIAATIFEIALASIVWIAFDGWAVPATRKAITSLVSSPHLAIAK